jgi:hypothetical protein
MPFPRESSSTRTFWANVDKTGQQVPHMDTPCWEWKGPVARNGYGLVEGTPWSGGSSHIYSWKLHHGAIPKGQQVLHKCDNRLCVRPDHLYLGTAEQNVQDQKDRGGYALDPWIKH